MDIVISVYPTDLQGYNKPKWEPTDGEWSQKFTKASDLGSHVFNDRDVQKMLCVTGARDVIHTHHEVL